MSDFLALPIGVGPIVARAPDIVGTRVEGRKGLDFIVVSGSSPTLTVVVWIDPDPTNIPGVVPVVRGVVLKVEFGLVVLPIKGPGALDITVSHSFSI